MALIEKKCWPEYFQAILDGEKTYELRIADFEANKGDTLLLREWDPKTKEYTGRKLEKQISFVVRTKEINFFKEEDVEQFGYQVIGLEK